MIGVSRDGGKTWTQELVNVRELDPEKSNLAEGNKIWFRKRQFVIKKHDTGRLYAAQVSQ